MKSIVSFTCPTQPIRDGEDDETTETPGKELAELIVTGFQRRGVTVQPSCVIEGIDGWSFWVLLDRVTIHFDLNIAGIRMPPQLRWVIGFTRSGLLASLYRWNVAQEMGAARDTLEAILHEDLKCEDVEWWSDQEFAKEV